MIASKIIAKFQLFTGDTTELSDVDSLDLLNSIYMKVLAQRTWRFLLKSYTGTIISKEVTLPTDFFFFPILANADISNQGEERFVYVGLNYRPYKIVNFEDRLKYDNQDGYCYIDLSDNKLKFTTTPTDTTVYFTYCYLPDELELTDEPIFPEPFHKLLYYGMVSDDMICQLFDKARSYATTTEGKYEEILNDLINYDSQFLNQ